MKQTAMKTGMEIILGLGIGILSGMLAHSLMIGLAGAVLSILLLLVKVPRFLQNGKYTWLLLVVGSPFFYFCVTEILNYHYPWNTMPVPFLFNILFYTSFIAVLYCLCGRLFAGLYGASVFSFILAVVNYFVRTYKDAPFTVYDVLSVRTLFNVLDGGMELRTDWVVAAGVLTYALYWIILWRLRNIPRKPGQRAGIVIRAAAAVFVVVLYTAVFGFGVLQKLGVDTTIYHAAEKNGFIVQFIEGYRSSKIAPPDGYSEEEVESLTESYRAQEESPEKYPNIIVIMNESFSDLRYYGEMNTDMEVMPFIDSLNENTVKGFALSSVFGGNTANSEWEFLTGNTMAFMPVGTVPYQMYLNTDEASLTRLLRSYGYETAAFHPYESSGWLRKQAWLHLGFEECYFIEDFDTSHPEDIVNLKLKDKANYQRMLQYVDEKGTDKPLFLFNVTIQNHTGGYHEAESELGYKVHLLGDAEGKYNYVEGYLTMMHESDAALQYLIEELEKRDEKWVVMMFGDHQVDFGHGNEYLETISGKSMDGRTEAEREDLYTIPYLIWANYDIDTDAVDTAERTSINYLSTRLLQTLHIPGSGYQAFLDSLSEEYPAINAKGAFLKNGEFIPLSELNGIKEGGLQNYRILQYENIFGGNAHEEFYEE